MDDPLSDGLAISPEDALSAPIQAEGTNTDTEVVMVDGQMVRATNVLTDTLADDGPLNMAERLVAQFGAWASTLAELWCPSAGPFFTSDGRLTADPLIFFTVEVEYEAVTVEP